ncbi:GNAT family N-acetyltransferase [Candidatus Sumerlaeota bacterium]|nr:GNAT family N-acetyltransferase [Candidatus Sumerlaeota bacterium]
MAMNGIPFPLELETDRLFIRPASEADAQPMREAIEESINALAPWMPWADHVPTLTEAKGNCVNAENAFKEGRDHRLHLFLKDSMTFIGGSGLHRVDWSVPKCEIGYWIRNSYARQGYITEAAAEIARFAFEQLKMNRVEMRMDTRNTRSRRVPERLDFMLEGVLRQDERHIDGTLRDTCVYAKIRDDGQI